MAQQARVYAQLNTRVDPTIREQAKKLAEATGTSLAEYVEQALRRENQRQSRKGA